MTDTKPRGAPVAAILGALFVVLIVVPAVISLAMGDGAICLAASACPLSAVNPCVRRPSFAVVGRCAVAINSVHMRSFPVVKIFERGDEPIAPSAGLHRGR